MTSFSNICITMFSMIFLIMMVVFLAYCILIIIIDIHKGNNKITEHRAIFQREMQNSYVNKQTKSVNNRKTGKT